MNTALLPIPVVDLFAGPGGLGEGFSSLDDGNIFQIAVSAEKDPIAHQTLQLRAFYRLLRNKCPEYLDDYYDFCNGNTEKPFSDRTKNLWEQAAQEAMCIEIGSSDGNAILDGAIQKMITHNKMGQPWVLIGGPPCQAYSLVGRARNKGKVDYKPEEDHRHFLYREYLRIIQSYQPDIFVMENVKGILSSKIDGEKIFNQILKDLANPDAALKTFKNGQCYRIVSLVSEQEFRDGEDPNLLDATKYIIRAEEYGVPQARHRVILLGIREDRYKENLPKLLTRAAVSVRETIENLPPLRSQLSKQRDTSEQWINQIGGQLRLLATYASKYAKHEKALSSLLERTSEEIGNITNTGATRMLKGCSTGLTKYNYLNTWFLDPSVKVWLNHETRSHRIDDLVRYGYAACFASIHKRSPKGHKEFNLPGLAPAHKNWETGKFSDRFRVQVADNPSTTITSHISKDGHYFIHYDELQCRSLTVREAARLQTFPDNYFFCGGRTQQYHQVGNAVPPFLANQIAIVVKNILASSV